MMKVLATGDTHYPIRIENDWHQSVPIDKWTIEDDKEWKAFIKELNKIRKQIKKGWNEK